MKKLSHILTTLVCCAPFGFACGAPVATTSGSNLTAYNPSTAYNNQWATLSNGRADAYSVNKTAKADFGNCNSVVLRCAQPKCGNGGCSDASVAASIVAGCVKSNDSCKQYGDDLIQFMTAQLVANSNVKINEQNLAMQQAAATAANEQSQQQMAAMQQQMQQMQQQMQQQQAESQQQLQEALAAQAAQSQQALQDMKTAATNAAMENEAGVSAYQQDAINRGVGLEVLERQKITGQIMTEIENAEVSLKAMKTAMQTSFEYAHCDARGNNCEGPRRVKKWRELARGFIEPYDNAVDKIYDAIDIAQLVGVDISQIYMMLNNSCNQWGQYLCPQMPDGKIYYNFDNKGSKNAPTVCSVKSAEELEKCRARAPIISTITSTGMNSGSFTMSTREEQDQNWISANCVSQSGCVPCTLVKPLTDGESIYQGWVGAENETKDGNVTVVACISGALDNSALFGRRARRKSGGNLVDVEVLDMWLSQVEPNSKPRNDTAIYGPDYCYAGTQESKLRTTIAKKDLTTKELCCDTVPTTRGSSSCSSTDNIDDCAFINPVYAICDAHSYNSNGTSNNNNATAAKKESDECIKSFLGNNKKFLIAMRKKPGDSDNKCEVVWCDANAGWKPNTGRTDCEQCANSDADGNVKCKDDEVQDSLALYQAMFVDSETREAVGNKVTALSQQMYKQYEYVTATLRRLKTQLEKAVLTTSLEAAGAKSENGGSGSSLLGGNTSSNDKEIVLPGAENCYNSSSKDKRLECILNNMNLIKSNLATNFTNARKQLKKTAAIARSEFGKDYLNYMCSGDITDGNKCDKECTADGLSKEQVLTCANKISNGIVDLQDDRERTKYKATKY